MSYQLSVWWFDRQICVVLGDLLNHQELHWAGFECLKLL